MILTPSKLTKARKPSRGYGSDFHTRLEIHALSMLKEIVPFPQLRDEASEARQRNVNVFGPAR